MRRLIPLLLIGLSWPSLASSVRANSVVWEQSQSRVDTTNYSSLGPYYWFANFNNPTPVTNAATDSFEARNLPNWVHFETRSAYIGKDDSGLVSDTTIRTGYSFEENGAHTAGGATTGGQPNFNFLTLPGGLVSGISGEALEVNQGLNNTSSQLQFRVLAGAPDSIRLWVVTDNGSGANYAAQRRIRVSLRDTTGPPTYTGDSNVVEAEALPGGVSLIATGSDPLAANGVADAWSFLLTGLKENDIITVRPSGANASFPGGPHYAGFAGLIIQPVPEPSGLGLAAMATVTLGNWYRRRRLNRNLS